MTELEARARWVCCPMCDRKICCFGASDCDAKRWMIERGEEEGGWMRLVDADDLPTHKQLEPRGNGNYEEVEIVYKSDIDNAKTVTNMQKMMGWICPVCGACLSPFTSMCPCGGNKWKLTTRNSTSTL